MQSLTKPSVVVLGAGSWGTALAAAATRTHPTVLWGRDAELIASLRATAQNTKYLPEVSLPSSLHYSADFDEVVSSALASETPPLFVLASPVAGFATLCAKLAGALKETTRPVYIVWTCKGFEKEQGFLPHQTASPYFAPFHHVHTGALSGPSFAKEVAQGLPVALTVASTDEALRQKTIEVFHGGAMRVYGSTDVVGVEVGGALKNVLALACGVSDGLGLGTNARAALLTRGLAEMIRLGTKLGAQAETFYGLTGLGDLILTATGDLSRNRKVGLALGQGKALQDILAATPHVAEGVNCARVVQQLAQKHQVSMPITDAVCHVLFEGLEPQQAVLNLLARDPQSLEFRPH